jgi:hypothetical protein
MNFTLQLWLVTPLHLTLLERMDVMTLYALKINKYD